MSGLNLKKHFSSRLAKAMFSMALVASGTAASATVDYVTPSADKANNAGIAEARLRFNSHLHDRVAYQLSADVGSRDLCGLATLGVSLTDVDLFKVSGEYRLEKLKYNFSESELETAKMHQTSLGVAYQRSLVWGAVTSIDASAGWSLSNSEKLGMSESGYYITTQRFLGGTQFYGATVGATVSAWQSATAHFAINYDYMNINRHFNKNRKGSGLGFSAKLIQQINADVNVEAKAEFRRPFNLYAASVNYSGLYKNMVVGVFAQGIQSFYNLPESSSIGLSLTYTMCDELASESTKGLVEWVNIPAFSQPEVLVATDESINNLS